MGNGQFGMHFIGSDSPNADILYKVGRFPYNTDSTTVYPTDIGSSRSSSSRPITAAVNRARSKSVGASYQRRDISYIGTKPFYITPLNRNLLVDNRPPLAGCACGSFDNNNNDFPRTKNFGQKQGGYFSYDDFRLNTPKPVNVGYLTADTSSAEDGSPVFRSPKGVQTEPAYGMKLEDCKFMTVSVNKPSPIPALRTPPASFSLNDSNPPALISPAPKEWAYTSRLTNDRRPSTGAPVEPLAINDHRNSLPHEHRHSHDHDKNHHSPRPSQDKGNVRRNSKDDPVRGGTVGLIRSDPPNPFGLPRVVASGYPQLSTSDGAHNDNPNSARKGSGGGNGNESVPNPATSPKKPSIDNGSGGNKSPVQPRGSKDGGPRPSLTDNGGANTKGDNGGGSKRPSDVGGGGNSKGGSDNGGGNKRSSAVGGGNANVDPNHGDGHKRPSDTGGGNAKGDPNHGEGNKRTSDTGGGNAKRNSGIDGGAPGSGSNTGGDNGKRGSGNDGGNAKRNSGTDGGATGNGSNTGGDHGKRGSGNEGGNPKRPSDNGSGNTKRGSDGTGGGHPKRSSQDVGGHRNSNSTVGTTPSRNSISSRKDGDTRPRTPKKEPPNRNLPGLAEVNSKANWNKPWRKSPNMRRSEPTLSKHYFGGSHHLHHDPEHHDEPETAPTSPHSPRKSETQPHNPKHGLRRYGSAPGPSGPSGGPLLMARKQSIENLKKANAAINQKPGEKNPEALAKDKKKRAWTPPPPSHPRELGLLGLVPTSSARLKKLMDFNGSSGKKNTQVAKPVEKGKSKMNLETIDEEVNDRVIPMLRGRSHTITNMQQLHGRDGVLRSALKGPNADLTSPRGSDGNDSQSVRGDKSIRFRGVPSTPPTPPRK